MNIEDLENEIAEQVRNGRTEVYLKIKDLNEIGFDIQKKKEERTFINVAEVRKMIQKYKFQQRIKVDGTIISPVYDLGDDVTLKIKEEKTK